jgi:DNA-binding CsgD family transcriptional regulator/tetratricopeptide (TPR) repeat protein
VDELGRGRAAYESLAWTECYDALVLADRQSPLSAPDLVLLAITAFMLGREDESIRLLERAHQRHSDDGDRLRASRCAFWIGMMLLLRGEIGPATGWLGRAQRLIESEGRDCAEQGYMLLPVSFQRQMAGDFEGAVATAAAAMEIGERFSDADLVALAADTQGEMLVRSGSLREGLGLLDEAMVAVTAGEVSPMVCGIVYCGVVLACEDVYELRRAKEWTAALTRWCDRQPDLRAYTGRCLVHRAQLMRLQGAWPEALEETRRADRRFEAAMNRAAAARASYLRAEVHRLRGEFAPAEEEYREASRRGLEPQPGLALLRLAQGTAEAAAASIERVLAETTDPLQRAGLLPAYVEIVLAVDGLDRAQRACDELHETATKYDTEMLHAMAAQARGAVELASGEAAAALSTLRRGWQTWEELEAPYEAARTRVLIGAACRALGDEEGFALELDAARSTFEQLGAAPDLAEVDALSGHAPAPDHGLTNREVEVLRLLATGKSNKEIAASLVISEHTVARHVQNIFTKLGVASRTAAGAYAFEHRLV